jgi:ribonuclease D
MPYRSIPATPLRTRGGRKSLMEYEYVDSQEQLQAVVDRLLGCTILGVDTEAAGYHRYHDRISLVQISSPTENFLIDPIAIDDLSALGALFENPAIQKIFHDADFDLRILDRDLGLRIENLFDTQIAAAFAGERSLGLGAIVERYLGISLPKAYQRADWAERPLTEGMMEYAATDTVHLSEVREKLIVELEKRGRMAWAQEEFTRREGTRWAEPEDRAEAFLKIKGARDLTPRGLAILRELYLWREDVGKERDQATFRVLANQAMLEMSLKAPTTPGDLRTIGGLSSGLADRRGRDILAAIKRGLAVPEEELPRFPPSRRWERDTDAEERSEKLRQARAKVAEELDLDQGFVVSRAVLDEVARQNPKTLEDLAAIPELRRWQVEALGPALLQALKS